MQERFARPLSITATLVAVVAVWLLAISKGLFGNSPISVAVQVLGILLVLWARFTFGFRSFHVAANPTRGALVTAGPYRYVRNPIYLGALLVISAGVAVHPSAGNLGLSAVAAIALVTRIICEERLLRLAYPEYQEYAKKTARLIPFVI